MRGVCQVGLPLDSLEGVDHRNQPAHLVDLGEPVMGGIHTPSVETMQI